MLIFVILILCILSVFLSIKEISIMLSWKKKKVISAKECHFCEIEFATLNTGVIKKISCQHPNGYQLDSLPEPLNCPENCDYAFYRNSGFSYERALGLTIPLKILLTEGFRILATLVPTIIAILKLMN